MRKLTLLSLLLSLLVLGLLKLSAAWGADLVALGEDYFQTQAGASFFFPGIGPVSFTGRPIGPGVTDTIVRRLEDAVINGGFAPIQIIDLSLQSTAPVNIGGSFFDVFVTLDPANLSKDTGTITMHGSLGGGTFDSTLNVFFDARFTPVGGGPGFDVFDSVLLTQNGATWKPTPDPGTLLIPGVDEGDGDRVANFHSGLGSNEVDFFPFPFKECFGDFCHPVAPTPEVPEPASLLLLGTALAGLSGAAGWARRPKKRASMK